MEERPKLKIALSKADKVLESVCLTLLVLQWVGVVVFYPTLPEQIPSHFNTSGQADAFSNKTSIFILPAITTIIYVGMTILNRYPHIYNYSATVTEKNAKQLYTSTTRLLRVMKLAVVVIFTSIVFMTIRTALVNGSGLGAWFLPVAIALMLMPTIVLLLQSLKSREKLG